MLKTKTDSHFRLEQTTKDLLGLMKNKEERRATYQVFASGQLAQEDFRRNVQRAKDPSTDQ